MHQINLKNCSRWQNVVGKFEMWFKCWRKNEIYFLRKWIYFKTKRRLYKTFNFVYVFSLFAFILNSFRNDAMSQVISVNFSKYPVYFEIYYHMIGYFIACIERISFATSNLMRCAYTDENFKAFVKKRKISLFIFPSVDQSWRPMSPIIQMSQDFSKCFNGQYAGFLSFASLHNKNN